MLLAVLGVADADHAVALHQQFADGGTEVDLGAGLAGLLDQHAVELGPLDLERPVVAALALLAEVGAEDAGEELGLGRVDELAAELGHVALGLDRLPDADPVEQAHHVRQQ